MPNTKYMLDELINNFPFLEDHWKVPARVLIKKMQDKEELTEDELIICDSLIMMALNGSR